MRPMIRCWMRRELRPIAALLELEEIPVDSYYVNIIAVYPQHRRSGAGAALMRDAERLARVQKFPPDEPLHL